MSDSIQPALSSEEWRKVKLWSVGKMIGGKVRGMVVLDLPDDHRHGAAACALFGQPFGFTHEDVTRNLAIAAHWQRTLDAQGPDATWDFDEDVMAHRRDLIAWHRSLASRISALLPQP